MSTGFQIRLDPDEKFHEAIQIRDGAVITTTDIKAGTIIYQGLELLSYRWDNRESCANLARDLEALDSKTRIGLETAMAELYPSKTKDVTREFVNWYSDSTPEQIHRMIRNPELRFIMILRQNHFCNGEIQLLYLGASRFNHSCQPKAKWEIKNGLLNIQVIQSLRAGEECTISYWSNLSSDRKERIALIKRTGGFTCYCQSCKVRECQSCGSLTSNLKRCGLCHEAFYCSRKCQRQDWSSHRSTCTQRDI